MTDRNTPEEAEELLPCPFCGAAVQLAFEPQRQYFGPDGHHAPGCLIGSIDFIDYADDQHAIREWNRRTPPDPTEPPFAAAKRGALPGQLRETKSSSEPALSELVDRAVAAVNGRFHDWTPTPAMLGYARAVARQALSPTSEGQAHEA